MAETFKDEMPLASLGSRVSGTERVNMMVMAEQYLRLDMTSPSSNHSLKKQYVLYPSKQTVIHYLHEILVNISVPEVVRDFLHVFYFILWVTWRFFPSLSQGIRWIFSSYRLARLSL